LQYWSFSVHTVFLHQIVHLERCKEPRRPRRWVVHIHIVCKYVITHHFPLNTYFARLRSIVHPVLLVCKQICILLVKGISQDSLTSVTCSSVRIFSKSKQLILCPAILLQ
jgi:hypothetical protein